MSWLVQASSLHWLNQHSDRMRIFFSLCRLCSCRVVRVHKVDSSEQLLTDSSYFIQDTFLKNSQKGFGQKKKNRNALSTIWQTIWEMLKKKKRCQALILWNWTEKTQCGESSLPTRTTAAWTERAVAPLVFLEARQKTLVCSSRGRLI